MDRLAAVIEDNRITYQGESRTVPGLSEQYPDVWAFQFFPGGGHKEMSQGENQPATASEFDALAQAWEDVAPVEEPPPEPETPTMEDLRQEAQRKIRIGFQDQVRTSVSQYPQLEIESWPQQEQEARALLDSPSADPQTIAPLVTMIADDTAGETPTDVANNIVQKAQQFRGIIGPAIRKRRQKYAEIETAYQAGDHAALEVIGWN